VRGFDGAHASEAVEDYAETFAYALGEFATSTPGSTPPPYGFQNQAGMPTKGQIARLRVAGMLPRDATKPPAGRVARASWDNDPLGTGGKVLRREPHRSPPRAG